MSVDKIDEALIKQAQEGLDELLELIAEEKDSNFLKEFFTCLFTPSELIDVGKRWLLVKELDKGTTQREIARMFKMSLCRITRGSRELKKENSAFQKMLDHSASKKKA